MADTHEAPHVFMAIGRQKRAPHAVFVAIAMIFNDYIVVIVQ